MNTPQKHIAALAALAVLAASTLGAATPVSAQVPFAGAPGFGQPHGERHPELRRALETLRHTEYDLRHANRDFGGHRQKAADLCHAAQNQILLALRSDRS